MYHAMVSRVFTRPFPGADNLLLGTCRGYQVIVSNAVADGTLGIFFEADGQLSAGFADEHDLIRRKDAEGNHAGGYFEVNRRVRSLKLRGAKSDGFWCEIEKLGYTGYDLSRLREGDQFDTLNGFSICNKYFTPATARARAGTQISNRAETKMFPRHVETGQFLRAVDQIPAGSILYVTEKLHGTSMRVAHALEEVPIKRWGLGKLWAKLWRFPTHEKIWKTLNASRNVILERRGENETGFYGKEKFRFTATEKITLQKGEVVFGELVGYTDTGSLIMQAQDTTALKDKKILKQYGPVMEYRYGTIPYQTKLFIYRILQSNEDGYKVDLSFPQVQARCRELGLLTVPLLFTEIYEGGESNYLQSQTVQRFDAVVNGESGTEAIPSTLDASHLMEGIVVRYESEHGTGWLKHKAFNFGVLEGYLKEKDDYVDAEEIA